jgi:hypothetical protein
LAVSGQIHWILDPTKQVEPAPFPMAGKMMRDAKLSSRLLEPPRGVSLAGPQTVFKSSNMRRKRLIEGVCTGLVVEGIWCVLLTRGDEASLGGRSMCSVCLGFLEVQRESMPAVAIGAFSVCCSFSVQMRSDLQPVSR